MSVTDGQKSTAVTFNNAFMSKSAASTTTAVFTLSNISDANSGASVSNLQRAINEIFDAAGMAGIGDGARKQYSSNNYITDGDSHKTAIGKLDAGLHSLALVTAAYTVFTLANNTAASDVTGLIVDSSSYKSFGVKALIYRESTGGSANIKAQRIGLSACFNGTSWEIVEGVSTPTDAGVTFTIDATTGQVKIATDNQAGTYQSSTSYLAWRLEDLV